MTARLWKNARRLWPVLAAGVLLQAGGCAANELLAGLATAMASSVLQQFVFTAFGL
ncbi:MAG TPA: hypothetical protein PKK06_11280 [Phycisphaerae bacterium]|nr:hypothetical protein [Phycisphaerae bacterium]HNU45822.1 hypothetical protein [Phycisphaerae bacterium]